MSQRGCLSQQCKLLAMPLPLEVEMGATPCTEQMAALMV